MKSIILERVGEALKESEELTQSILDSAFDAIISMDSKGMIRNWNKGAESIFGWPASQVIGKNLAETIIPPRYREPHCKSLDRFITTGKSRVLNQEIELSALHKNGTEFPIEITISATKWSDSFIFTGIIRDITRRKRAEELTRQRTEEYELMHEIAKILHIVGKMDSMLKEAMKTIVKSKTFHFESKAGIFLLDEDEHSFNLISTIGDFSEADEELFLSHGIAWNKIVTSEESVKNCCLIDLESATGSPHEKNNGLYLVPLNGHTGHIGILVLFPTQITPYYERNNEILISIGGLIADAIEHHRCEELTRKQNQELSEANKKLSELNKLKNKFLGIASHDLRNPLYLIKSYSEILMDELTGDAHSNNKKHAAKIHSSSQFMQSLLDNLLDISKIESGNFELDLMEQNLNELVENQFEIFRLIAQKKDIGLCLDLSDIPPTKYDQSAIAQSVGNLISNAIKFSPHHSKIQIATALDPNGFIRFSVTDEGPGICSEEQKLLFDEFQTLSPKPTGGEKATGLGLAIVKKLIGMHGGKVEVICERGKGSTFYFTLPC